MPEDVRVATKEEEYLSLYESIRELYLEIFSNENELYSILTDFYVLRLCFYRFWFA